MGRPPDYVSHGRSASPLSNTTFLVKIITFVHLPVISGRDYSSQSLFMPIITDLTQDNERSNTTKDQEIFFECKI